MEQKYNDIFLQKKIEKIIDKSQGLVTLFGTECILKKSMEKKTNNGLLILSQEFLAKYLVARSWKYAFEPDTKLLLNHEIASFCERLQYFSQLPTDASEKDVIDFIEHKNISKIREYVQDSIFEFFIFAEEALRVPEDELIKKGVFKLNRAKDTNEITNCYVYRNYSETAIQENIGLLECKIKELTKDALKSKNHSDGAEVNSEILKMSKDIISKLVDECRDKTGFQKGVSLIDAEIIPLLKKDIEDYKKKETEILRLELVNLLKSFKSKIRNNSSFIVEISKDDIICKFKEG